MVCLFFIIGANERYYGHWRSAGAFTAAERQSELKISEANAGAKRPKCIACPDSSGSACQ